MQFCPLFYLILTTTLWGCLLFSHQDISNSLQPHGLYLAHQAPLSSTISWSLLRFISIELVMPSNHLILCHPLLLPSSIFPSIRVFSNESTLHIRWPKSWSFSFNISPSNEPSGLISFRMDWLDLLSVQGTLKSLLQQLKSIISLALSFFYSPTLTSIHNYWKTIALTRWTFVGKIMPLLFNMLSRLITWCEELTH